MICELHIKPAGCYKKPFYLICIFITIEIKKEQFYIYSCWTGFSSTLWANGAKKFC